ncbi:unnamed protein product [Adineta steineri]|uniref:Uncharacterized protein n=1 Tax=Adineta steineri TaxID=433720 RepID=A0A818P0Y7_9BILA|nr:unnamed protein product [Adineta steineri]CAF1490811.1 unnamed protein product [Adineta steineri]CAF1620236.1 unnamed protein product [Adineta steineri]CAF3613903.1 unnamed protein product [Adineta steineri]
MIYCRLICLLFTSIAIVLGTSDLSKRAINENPIVELSVYPNAGVSTENIQVRCQITQLSLMKSPLSSSKFDNVYLSVKTDTVKPSGIVLMFDDSSDGCRLNRENIRIDVCNASLILIHINHTILNETLQKIDYSCSKGTTYAYSSYRIIKDQSARYYDPTYNSSSTLTANTYFLLLFVCFITQIIRLTTRRIQ